MAARLLAASKDAVADGVDVPASKTKTFAAAYSWWCVTCRSAEAVLLLSKHGFTVEASPIVRNVVNHAYAPHWLADNGDPAVAALMANSLDEADKLAKKLELSGWPGAAGTAGFSSSERPRSPLPSTVQTQSCTPASDG